jgi:hypothetical protein
MTNETTVTLQERMNDLALVPVDETPKMKFYVGDLCYVLTRDDWDTYCAAFDWQDPNTHSDEDGYDPEIWLAPEKGDWETWLADKGAEPWRPCQTYSTAYGDGCYNDQNGNPYSVDSGGIGCIRVDHANQDMLADAVARGLGHIHEFAEKPSSGYTDGLIWFCDHTNQVEINTGGDYEEEETDEE